MSGFTSQNYMATTSPQNSFLLDTQGYVQGVMLDDAVAQQWITTGIIPATETAPLWAGLPIIETGNAATSISNQGGRQVSLAASIATITGFTIANQGYNGIIGNPNNVPMYSSGMTMSLIRLHSNARVVVQVDSAAVNSLINQSIAVQLGWDFTTNSLTTFTSGTALPAWLLEIETNGKIVSYNSGTGEANWSTGPVAVIQLF